MTEGGKGVYTGKSITYETNCTGRHGTDTLPVGLVQIQGLGQSP